MVCQVQSLYGGRAPSEERIVAKFVVAGIFAMLLGLQSAGAENWCVRDFGDPPDKPCVAAPLEYCLQGIRLGGVCARDRSYLQDKETRDPPQKHNRRGARKERRDR
jgi:hypothetical protein